MTRRRLFDYRRVPRRERTLILAAMLFWSVLATLFIRHFVFESTEVVGVSMSPTLQPGKRLLINRTALLFRSPKRGEIVAFTTPGDPDCSVKRVMALPGESIQIKGGRVLVNGRALDEPYLAPEIRTGPGAIGTNIYVVAPDCYFVLGDNRARSADSRAFGAIGAHDLVGTISP